MLLPPLVSWCSATVASCSTESGAEPYMILLSAWSPAPGSTSRDGAVPQPKAKARRRGDVRMWGLSGGAWGEIMPCTRVLA